MSSCPPGYHSRKTYKIKKTGTRVPATCVLGGEGHRAFVHDTVTRMSKRLRGVRLSKRGPTSCPAGQILRRPYVRVQPKTQKRIFVAGSCITDRGAPRKGGASGSIGPLRKGDLKQFGYDDVRNMTQGARHIALAKAVRAYGPLSLWRKLNAIYIYTRNTAPASSAIFKQDRDWIRSQYGVKA